MRHIGYVSSFLIWRMTTPLDECIERDALRKRPIGERRIRELWDKLAQQGDIQ